MIFFSVSVLRVDKSELSRASIDEYIDSAANLSSSLNNLANERDTVKVWLSFYFHYGRLESTDPTTNWRLDIWQDVTFDMFEEGIIDEEQFSKIHTDLPDKVYHSFD